MTQKHKDKIGKAVKRGKFIKCKNCGKRVWASPCELKRKTPKGYCNRECFKNYYKKHFIKKGKENYFWKNGGIGYLKRETLKRDNWTCQTCGFRDKEIMEADHIKEKAIGGKDELDNMQTLCPNCHRRKTINFLKKYFKNRKLPYAGK